ncbi:hypothetical protein SAMN05421594_2448 [Chryseobacterium oleae]|uniref:Uncharacterized protein n=1 Tax=Chryseobacterium oleae TaxID=491207 RepID=A0A1I4YIN3_CHROL|nr:hypothetical protein SAMN05421594_2448 [Chryseobacterium oleae]
MSKLKNWTIPRGIFFSFFVTANGYDMDNPSHLLSTGCYFFNYKNYGNWRYRLTVMKY